MLKKYVGIRLASFLCGLMVCVFSCVNAEKIQSSQGDLDGRVTKILANLDHDRHHVREAASAELAALAKRSELSHALARILRTALIQPETSLEVRIRLRKVVEQLPDVDVKDAVSVRLGEIDHLIGLLEADDYGSRVGAASRLHWLSDSPRHAPLLMTRLKQQLLRDGLALDIRTRLEGLYDHARGTWLINEPIPGRMPKFTNDDIQRLASDLTRSLRGQEKIGIVRGGAQRELLDLLARAEYTAAVKDALEDRRLNQRLDDDAVHRIDQILEWCKHGMVAEYWTLVEEDGKALRQHLGVQYLIIGVPQLGPGALRPSHFDKCSDKVAHCVSGNSLSPGNYPVFQAIPHPNSPAAIFHMINLPTPRRRMAYDYWIKREKTEERLRQITQRTCDALLRGERELTLLEVQMLRVLDPPTVSNYIGKHFARNRPADPPVVNQPNSGTDMALCNLLSQFGSHEALPGLKKALKRGRFSDVNSDSPFHLPWMLTIVLALRDPWPNADAWLAQLIEEESLLYSDSDVDIGATAAAMLLKRQGHEPADFGLDTPQLPVDLSSRVAALHDGLEVYRFQSAEDRQSVIEWWNRKRAAAQ